jgi:adapter protein MecA 1/2
VKFILSNADLSDRNIKVAELVNGTERVHELLHEMMVHAMSECGFSTGNMPLMIEASTINNDGVVIIVTKMNGFDEVEDKLANIAGLAGLKHVADTFRHLMGIGHQIQEQQKNTHGTKCRRAAVANDPNIFIFSFAKLDDVVRLAASIGRFNGQNSLYKFKERYYLIAHSDFSSAANNKFVMMMHEYGEKYISNAISRQHIKEHGELIIQENALAKLAKYLK